MKSKLVQIPYTIGIVKPHLVLKDKEVSKFLNETLDAAIQLGFREEPL